jgi:asparagine synthase (glutamine-hydrolysing)
MCGINGVFAYGHHTPAVDVAELLRSRDAMRPRGPDGAGMWYPEDRRVGLAHRRLAIIDLSEQGAQPMSTEDARYTIVFNGEIYNYPELRGELSNKGVHFRSHTDTEVLLHLYRREGAAMLGKLRGMFAFAIWDTATKQLFLARDPYGIKPLYYSDKGGYFRFASQVKALLAGGGVAHDLDPGGMAGFFLWGSVPEPLTLYREIRMLPAGGSVCVDAQGMGPITKYWNIGEAISASMSAANAIPVGAEREYFKEALRDSITSHLIADVPVGAFLSAGLDSSTILGLATELSGQPVESITFTCDEFKGKQTDELPLANVVATHYQSKHHVVSISTQDMENRLPAFLEAMDQPTIDGINTWFVAEAAAKAGLKVVLSGLGGDELLGGYATFRKIPRSVHAARRIAWLPGLPTLWQFGGILLSRLLPSLDPKRAALLSLGTRYEGAYQLERGLLMPWQLDSVMDADFARIGLRQLHEAEEEERLQKTIPHLEGFARIVELESTRYMRNQLLRDTDWAGMAHSLEIRTPLVDAQLTEKVVGLAALGRLGEGKSIMPQALDRPLPQALITRPKTGFTVPIWKWLRHSEAVDAWRRIKLLHRPQVHDYTRWAFSVVAHLPETRHILK